MWVLLFLFSSFTHTESFNTHDRWHSVVLRRPKHLTTDIHTIFTQYHIRRLHDTDCLDVSDLSTSWWQPRNELHLTFGQAGLGHLLLFPSCQAQTWSSSSTMLVSSDIRKLQVILVALAPGGQSSGPHQLGKDVRNDPARTFTSSPSD